MKVQGRGRVQSPISLTPNLHFNYSQEEIELIIHQDSLKSIPYINFFSRSSNEAMVSPSKNPENRS